MIKFTTQFTMRLEEELYRQLELVSDETGLPKSEVVRIALSKYLSEILSELNSGKADKDMPGKEVVGRVIREIEFRQRIESLYNELMCEVDVRNYYRYRALLQSLRRSKKSVYMDDELREKFEFVVSRIMELGALHREISKDRKLLKDVRRGAKVIRLTVHTEMSASAEPEADANAEAEAEPEAEVEIDAVEQLAREDERRKEIKQKLKAFINRFK